MAYTEVSIYEYITGDELEVFAKVDYSVVDATYTEAVVMAKVTLAERWVNSITKESFSGTIPDGVIIATSILAERLMFAQMYKDGWKDKEDWERAYALQPFFDKLFEVIEGDVYSPVDSIPMQGIDR